MERSRVLPKTGAYSRLASALWAINHFIDYYLPDNYGRTDLLQWFIEFFFCSLLYFPTIHNGVEAAPFMSNMMD